jgi:hypothetical protein
MQIWPGRSDLAIPALEKSIWIEAIQNASAPPTWWLPKPQRRSMWQMLALQADCRRRGVLASPSM